MKKVIGTIKNRPGRIVSMVFVDTETGEKSTDQALEKAEELFGNYPQYSEDLSSVLGNQGLVLLDQTAEGVTLMTCAGLYRKNVEEAKLVEKVERLEMRMLNAEVGEDAEGKKYLRTTFSGKDRVIGIVRSKPGKVVSVVVLDTESGEKHVEKATSRSAEIYARYPQYSEDGATVLSNAGLVLIDKTGETVRLVTCGGLYARNGVEGTIISKTRWHQMRMANAAIHCSIREPERLLIL